jgi:hypothetical protein
VVGATGVFHKKSQLEFAKATRLQKKDLARWQRNMVDMAIHDSCQIFHESMEKANFIRRTRRRQKLSLSWKSMKLT